MEGVEGRWSVSLDPVMKSATTEKVMSLALALEVATAGNVILPDSILKVAAAGVEEVENCPKSVNYQGCDKCRHITSEML